MKDQISCQSLVQRRHCSLPAQELTQTGESCTCCIPHSTAHTHPDSSAPRTLPAALHIWMSLAGALPEASCPAVPRTAPKSLGFIGAAGLAHVLLQHLVHVGTSPSCWAVFCAKCPELGREIVPARSLSPSACGVRQPSCLKCFLIAGVC